MNKIGIAALLLASALVSPASALGDKALDNADDLIVKQGQVMTLDGGAHTFDDLVIGDDGILRVAAGTNITANRIHSDGGKIEYIEGSGNGATPTITLIGLDASAVRDLAIVGHGKDGEDATQTAAAAGPHGRDARSRVEGFKVINHKSTPGGDGQHGVRGGNGEDGAQVTVYLVGAQPGALIRFNAVGGDGGRGQPGGAGGNGGNKSRLHSESGGGTGGNGGQGGDAGDSGRVTAYLIADSVSAEIEPNWIKVVANVAAGQRGEGGARGPAGRRGHHGNKGALGAVGKAPTDTSQDDFAQVLIMDRATFAEFALANKVINTKKDLTN